MTADERAATWAIIAGHPSSCACAECTAMRILNGFDTVGLLGIPENVAMVRYAEAVVAAVDRLRAASADEARDSGKFSP